MRSGLAMVATCACALAACGKAEGLLISVDLGSGVDPAQVGAIDVWVGEPGTPARHFIRNALTTDAQKVAEWPFQILITPGDQPITVFAGAFGYADLAGVGGAPYAMGAMGHPIEIVPGELQFAGIILDRTFAPDSDCIFAPGDGMQPSRAIIPADAAPDTLDCDNDGFSGDDCNDLDPFTNGMADEICDGRDNNCDGRCDENLDADGDGYSQCDYGGCGALTQCDDGATPPPALIGSCDCDDTHDHVFPGAPEATACDGLDTNCDGNPGGVVTDPVDLPGNHIDDDCDGVCDPDLDQDLIAIGDITDPVGGSWSTSCDLARPDCDDAEPETYPNALEMCDGVNSNCSETPDLSPPSGPCFINVGGMCMLGRQDCMLDEPVGFGWGACIPGSVEVAGELCAAWDQVGSAPWPEKAGYDALAGSPEDRETCTLTAWRQPITANQTRANALCPEPHTRIPNRMGGSSGCTTLIAGGAVRGGYTLSLVTHDAVPRTGASVPSCDVDLVVEAVEGEGDPAVRLPAVWVLLIQQRDNGGVVESVAIPVEVRVAYADASSNFACPAVPRSLDCDP